jgi:NADP-dependent 3-hydroxy acid dehydrogenase YdfG
LSECVALVAGASGDIGQAICAAFACAGVQVIAIGRNRERLAALAARHPEAIEPVVADQTHEVGRATAQTAAARRGRLDLLVLGSGIYERSDNPGVLARQFAANVEAPYALLHALLPLLAGSSGLVVFLNSTQGLIASPGVGQFAATQHAMRAIANSLREEVNPDGIRVSSVFLGRTATTRQAAIFAAEGRPYAPERLIQPDDVARMVLALFTMPTTAEVTDISVRPRLKF